MDYNPRVWFWIVAGDTSRAWSSAAGTYVADYDSSRVTRIVSEAELNDVLRPYGLTLPAPTQADYSRAIQQHIDAVARAEPRDFDSGFAAATYVTSTNPKYAADAQAFVAWRDAVWTYAYGELARVQSADREQPTIEALIAELPAMVWPE